MSESKPMKWSELRARVAHIRDKFNAGHDLDCRGLANLLLADIDAAAPAMERQAELAAMAVRRAAFERVINGERP